MDEVGRLVITPWCGLQILGIRVEKKVELDWWRFGRGSEAALSLRALNSDDWM
jgi:hypothetical protein